MTRRERKEARLERRLDWAAGREAKAAAKFAAVHRLADSIPLGQPILVGHHSEKHARKDQERIHNGMAAGIASQDMAAHHRSVAGGIADQLERSIFSDDTDAVTALEARIAQLEDERERMKRANAAIRKGPGWQARLEAAGLVLTPDEVAQLASVARHQSYYCDKKTGQPLFPPYALSNLGGRISTDRKRLGHLKAQQARAEQATAAGGLLVEYIAGQRFERFDEPTPEGMHGRHVSDPTLYVSVTFEEKPARTVLETLRGAGFYWGGGRWQGETAKLPEGFLEQLQKGGRR